MEARKAVVLFSGGQDSTTLLFWAKKHFDQVIAFTIAYGQRHEIELTQAKKIAQIAEVEHVIIPMNFFHYLAPNALTHETIPVEKGLPSSGTLPNTFVPGRNLFFLTAAAAFAYHKNIHDLVGGMCQTDYSGYPDCREPFIQSAEKTLSLAMDFPFKIHTPLMYLTKAQTWQMAKALGCLEIVIEYSHTCYQGERTKRHPWGYGCGECPACLLRKRGFEEAFPC